jgi:hypothetical protein
MSDSVEREPNRLGPGIASRRAGGFNQPLRVISNRDRVRAPKVPDSERFIEGLNVQVFNKVKVQPNTSTFSTFGTHIALCAMSVNPAS